MKKWLTIAVAAVVCGVLWLTRVQEQPVALAQVQVRTLTEKIEAVGTVVPAQTYALMPTVTGGVKNVFVKQGQHVEKGQAVAEVELLPEDAANYLVKLQNTGLDEIDVQEQMRKACTVTAPQSGSVTAMTAYEGMPCAPGSALGVVADDELNVIAHIPESLREEIYVGQEVRILRAGAEYGGNIATITAAEDMEGQYRVTVRLKPLQKNLAAGMKVDVEIILSECTGPSVPLQAVQPDGTVKCRTEEGVAAVPVQTGLCTELYAQLLSGPPVGTQVVIGEE